MIENNKLREIEEDYMKSLEKVAVLDNIEDYLEDIRNGDLKLMKLLVNTYMVMIPSIAVKFVREDLNVAYMDLIQEANYALLEHTQYYFDNKLKEDFDLYIKKHIEKAIEDFIKNEEVYVNVPQEEINLILKVHSTMDELKEKYNRQPTFKEIKEAFKDIDDDKLKLFIALKNG